MSHMSEDGVETHVTCEGGGLVTCEGGGVERLMSRMSEEGLRVYAGLFPRMGDSCHIWETHVTCEGGGLEGFISHMRPCFHAWGTCVT